MEHEIVVNESWCKGCHICVEVCPRNVLEVNHNTFLRGFHPVRVARLEDCTVCRQCELLCPDLAIRVAENSDQLPVTSDQLLESGNCQPETGYKKNREGH